LKKPQDPESHAGAELEDRNAEHPLHKILKAPDDAAVALFASQANETAAQSMPIHDFRSRQSDSKRTHLG